jgi:hypothetical protein
VGRVRFTLVNTPILPERFDLQRSRVEQFLIPVIGLQWQDFAWVRDPQSLWRAWVGVAESRLFGPLHEFGYS